MSKKFTTADFEKDVLQAEVPVLVDFYADWCGPCKMMAPLVDQLSADLEGSAIIGKVNIDEEEEIASKYGIMTIPTLMVFYQGKSVGKLIGVQSREAVEELIRAANV